MRASRVACLLVLLCSVVVASAQQPTTQTAAKSTPTVTAQNSGGAAQPAAAEDPKPAGPLPTPDVPADLQKVVNTQFGPNFKVAAQRVMTRRYLHDTEHADWSPFMVGDLDGDGAEDAVIVARAKNAFGGQIPYKYRVIDPYFSA